LPGILVLSDIHGNHVALTRILEEVRGWDEIVVLGDLVDYGPSPGEVIDTLREIGARIVRGNHDHAAAYGVDCRAGERVHWLSVWTRENITLKRLSRADRDFLASLPLGLKLDLGYVVVEAYHASPRDPLYDYPYPWLGEGDFEARFNAVEPRGGGIIYLVGHTHYQFYRATRKGIVVNPGSVGQPRDGDPRASYAILDPERGLVSLGRVRYDVESVVENYIKLGVPEPYLTALTTILRAGRIPPGWPPRI
jgi:predicted phosphodiesterase